MNRYLILALGLLSFLVFPEFAHSQEDPAIPTPTPPYVIDPPPGSSWVIDVVYSDKKNDSKPPNPTKASRWPVRFDLAVDPQNIELCTIAYSNNTEEKFYIYKGRILQEAKQSSKVLMWIPTSYDQSDVRDTGFPQAHWISNKNYVGIENVGRIPCYKYQSDNSRTAYIDATSRCPVSIVIKTATYKFSRRSSAVDRIDLPPNFLNVIKQTEIEKKALEAIQHQQ